MTYLKELIIIIFFIWPNNCYCQILSYKCYDNKEGTFICLSGDTIIYKINTQSGLLNYLIGASTFEFRKNKIIMRPIDLFTVTTEIKNILLPNLDSFYFELHEYDNMPMISTTINVFNKGENIFTSLSNMEGKIYIGNNILMEGTEYDIKIRSLTFETDFKYRYKKGEKVLIKSKVKDPFSIFKSNYISVKNRRWDDQNYKFIFNKSKVEINVTPNIICNCSFEKLYESNQE